MASKIEQRLEALQQRISLLETERDAAEERATQFENLSQYLFDNPLAGYAIVGQEGHFERVNQRMSDLVGFTPEQLMTMGPFDVTPKEGHEELRQNITALKTGKVPYFVLQKKLMRNDGSSFWDESAVQVLRNEAGEIQGFLGTFVDISEAHNLREDLNASEALFWAVIKQSNQGISVVDDDDKRILVNQAYCRMVGYSEQELMEGGIEDVILEADKIKNLYSQQGDQARFETLIRRKDGSTFVAEIAVNSISVGTQQLKLAFVHDATSRLKREQERLELEAQIQQAQKLESLGVLAGGIAHDFNNLLVGILGNAEITLHDMSRESPARDSVQDIAEAAERAADLVRQMLAYAGKGRFVVEKLQISRLVQEMGHLLEVSISKKAVLRYELGQNLPMIEADATQVRQIVMNLITNASDAIEAHSGVVSICTGAMECDHAYLSETYLDDDLPEGQYVYVEVSDTGVGLDWEARSRIFDPFFTTKFAGRGLGLAAVLGIVRGHKGAIKVYSEPGKGSTFKVLFPASADGGAMELAHSENTQFDSFSGCVLLVDDEETVRSVGKRMLERIGFEVETASDGREALDAFRRDPDRYSVVLLDLTMPHLDGEGCFRELRRVNANVRVILSSGYNQQELTTRFAGKGLAGFIQKPYRMQTLREELSKVLKANDVVDAQ